MFSVQMKMNSVATYGNQRVYAFLGSVALPMFVSRERVDQLDHGLQPARLLLQAAARSRSRCRSRSRAASHR